jgi:hypothetical protein
VVANVTDGTTVSGVRPEAAAAAAWWAGELRAAGADPERVAVFERALAERVEALCDDAGWDPEVPTAHSCGRVLAAGPPPDPALARPAARAGLRDQLEAIATGVTMQLDPGSVSVRRPGTEPATVWPATVRPR